MTVDRNRVEFEVEVLPEDCAIHGNVMASGDAETDHEVEQWVLDQLGSGNEWAWCTVKVVAIVEGFEGVAYLGCCSYESEADFKDGGYFEDLCDEAYDDLCRNVKEAQDSFIRLGLMGERY